MKPFQNTFSLCKRSSLCKCTFKVIEVTLLPSIGTPVVVPFYFGAVSPRLIRYLFVSDLETVTHMHAFYMCVMELMEDAANVTIGGPLPLVSNQHVDPSVCTLHVSLHRGCVYVQPSLNLRCPDVIKKHYCVCCLSS